MNPLRQERNAVLRRNSAESAENNDLALIREELQRLNAKLDAISNGPVFTSTLTRIATLDQQCADNLKALNTMMLQIKGVLSQVSTIRGKGKSDWYREEIPAEHSKKKNTILLENKE